MINLILIVVCSILAGVNIVEGNNWTFLACTACACINLAAAHWKMKD